MRRVRRGAGPICIAVMSHGVERDDDRCRIMGSRVRVPPRSPNNPTISRGATDSQIAQSTVFKALRKPPNALSRQGSVSLAPLRSEMVVRLISVAFGFDLGRAA